MLREYQVLLHIKVKKVRFRVNCSCVKVSELACGKFLSLSSSKIVSPTAPVAPTIAISYSGLILVPV